MDSLGLVFLSLGSLLGTQQPKITPSRGHPPVTAMAALPDGTGVLVGSQSGVFEVTDNDPKRVLATELDYIHDLSFSPDGSLLAVAGGSPGEAGDVELWSITDKKRVGRIEGHDDVVYAAKWLDAKTLVTGSADRTVRVWDTATGTARATLTGHSAPVLCLAVSPDGKLVCSGGADQTIRVWDAATWQPMRSLTNHLGTVHSLAFRSARNGDIESAPIYLASAGADATVRIWQPEIGRMVRIVRHASPVLSVCWDGDGYLLSGSKNGQICSIDADVGETLRCEQVGSSSVTHIEFGRVRRTLWIGNSSGRVQAIPPIPARK